MATIKSTLQLQDKMSRVFNNISRAANETGNSFDNVGTKVAKMNNKLSKASGMTSSFMKGFLGASAIQKVFGMITSGLDSAIDRYDTLNNYIKVMSNLGISEEQAEASRKRLSDGLKGLPTTLNEGVIAVQKFTSANSNVEASTEMFLALNNAILAGGASTEIQKSALEQLSQAYAKGKPDMMEWRTAMTAMPGQLKQISKAMGKTTTELGDGLRSGQISMNDFMKTVVQLNREGIDGFQNFEEQAKNATGGIGTTIKNLQSAIQRGWVSMIDGANNALTASGLPTIQQIIENLGNSIEQVMTRIGTDLLPQLGLALQEFGQAIDSLKNTNNNDVNSMLDLWDYFMLGLQTVKLGADVVFNGLKVGALTLWLGMQTVCIGIVGAFKALQTGIQTVVLGIIAIFQGLVNSFIDGINAMIDVINLIPGVDIERKERVTWAKDYSKKMISDVNKRNQDLANMTIGASDTAAEIKRLSTENVDRWSDKVTGIKEDLNKRRDKSATEKATEENTNATKSIEELFKGITDNNSSGTGGKAVKTTSDDKLIDDEDIQLLLDVATRDYKLNYQQVTPQITMTFGDIRENADVDVIADQLAERLQEIVDGNLEVQPA